MLQSQHDDELTYWIALSLIKGLGGVGICQLLTRFGSPQAVFNANMSQLKEIVKTNVAQKIKQNIDTNAVQPSLDWLNCDNNHIITLADNHYPKQLLEISNPPPILYAIGHLNWLNHAAIAIVGSRNATPQGEKNAEHFAQSLAKQNLCIISGMALGIDSAAHRGTLKHSGGTIAVVGTGLDIVYPAKNRELAHHIAERGLIISEFPLGTPPKAQNFTRRNRVISGLSLGCLVVEANVGSGSLITARAATEQGREVFAIPGSIHSPVSKGCHALIKQGAKLVENTADILDELKNIPQIHTSIKLQEEKQQAHATSLEANAVLEIIGFEAINFETILSNSGLTTEALSSMLTVLELEGKVAALAGGQYQRLV